MMMMRRVMCVLAVVLCCACSFPVTDAWDWQDFLGDTSKKYNECSSKSGYVFDGESCKLSVSASETEGPKNEVQRNDVTTQRERREEAEQAQLDQVRRETEQNTLQDARSKGEESHEDPANSAEGKGQKTETGRVPGTQNQIPESTAASQGNQEASSTTSDSNSTAGNSNPNQEPPATGDATAVPDSHETNSITPPSPENTTTEAPTTTPSHVPNSEINTITTTVQNKANVDSSINTLWMRTTAPLLVVIVLFSFTVY